jgi:hypothetical protein
MDASQFKHLINADHYSPADLEQVNDLCRNYPMFNLAHLLKVRIRESLAYKKEVELKVAAVYASDRRKLYRLVAELSRPVEEETPSEDEGIVFSSERPEVDVIIEQHAPYAGTQPADDDLLELEDEVKMAEPETPIKEPETPIKETPAKEDKEPVVEEGNPRGNRLILDFLREDPGPIRANQYTARNRDVSMASVREHDGFITDTLAKIYVKQGLYAKAIYAYEKLSLKYPEKSAYFAAQIEKIGNINHS